jgi:signal transduction histidine kinase
MIFGKLASLYHLFMSANKVFYYLMIVGGSILSAVVLWDYFALGIVPTWHYAVVKTYTIGGSFLAAYLTKKDVKLDYVQIGYSVIFYAYCFYGLSILDMSYHYAYIEGFMFFCIMFGISFKRFSYTVAFGYLSFLLALYLASEPSYIAQGESYKPHALVSTTILAAVSLVLYRFITGYRIQILKLNEQFALIGRQSSFLMHEIKTPLSRVVRRVEAMEPDLRIDEIRRDSHRISSIVLGVETLISNPKTFRKTFQDFTWDELDQSLQLDFSGFFEHSDIKFQTYGFEGRGFGNKHLLYQVLKNLTTNSIEAISKQATGPQEITVKLEKTPASIAIIHENTGSSIPPHIITQIFEPLFTTKSQTENRGLGLTLVKTIIEAHDGAVSASSSGKSTAFHIKIPMEMT